MTLTMTMKRRICFGWLSAVLAILSCTPTARSQGLPCKFLPDNLDGTPCSPAEVQLPVLPRVEQQIKYACWASCEVRLSALALAELRPVSVACGIYLLRYRVTNQTGSRTIWTGDLVMTYSRTFAETQFTDASPDTQVWRFLINGDLKLDPAIVKEFENNSCVVPSCYLGFDAYHVAGYVDYALNCVTGTWSVAHALDHDCDASEHRVGCRIGDFHPNRSYSWVGPAEGFVWDPGLSPAEGNLVGGGVRNFDYSQPLAEICKSEDPLSQGVTVTQSPSCYCVPNQPRAFQYTSQLLNTRTVSGTVVTENLLAPWAGLSAKSLGTWTDPNTYPGPETLHLERGVFDYCDGCTNTFTNPFFAGVQTTGGYLVFGLAVGDPLFSTNNLIDLGNATWPPGNPNPVIGKRSVPDKLMYFYVEPGGSPP